MPVTIAQIMCRRGTDPIFDQCFTTGKQSAELMVERNDLPQSSAPPTWPKPQTLCAHTSERALLKFARTHVREAMPCHMVADPASTAAAADGRDHYDLALTNAAPLVATRRTDHGGIALLDNLQHTCELEHCQHSSATQIPRARVLN